MNHLLHLRVYPDHPLVQIGMIPHQNVWVPRRSDKYGIHTRPNRRHEYLTNLQSDEEGESHDHRRKSSPIVVTRLREFEVEIRKEGADISHKGRSHRQYRSNQAVIDQCINSAILHHGPRVLGSGDVSFAVEGDVNEGIAIDKSRRSAGTFDAYSKMFSLNGPIDQSNDASKAAERDGGSQIPSLSLLLLSYATCLAYHVDERHDQRSKADTAKGVRKSSPCCAPCGTTWHTTWLSSAEEPATIDTGDDGVDRVFEPNGVEKSAVFQCLKYRTPRALLSALKRFIEEFREVDKYHSVIQYPTHLTISSACLGQFDRS